MMTPSDPHRPGSFCARLRSHLQERYPMASKPDDAPLPEADDALHLRSLPPEVGTLLIVVGIAGLLLPGPVGSPFVIAGGISLWPSALGRVDDWFKRRFPKMHREGMGQVGRFLADLEHRYPGTLR